MSGIGTLNTNEGGVTLNTEGRRTIIKILMAEDSRNQSDNNLVEKAIYALTADTEKLTLEEKASLARLLSKELPPSPIKALIRKTINSLSKGMSEFDAGPLTTEEQELVVKILRDSEELTAEHMDVVIDMLSDSRNPSSCDAPQVRVQNSKSPTGETRIKCQPYWSSSEEFNSDENIDRMTRKPC